MLAFHNPQKDKHLSATSLDAIKRLKPLDKPSLGQLAAYCDIKNFCLIQDAYEAGHLNYISEFIEQTGYSKLLQALGKENANQAFFLGAYYNPDYFDMSLLDSHGTQAIFSKLKSGVNATDAMLSLLTEGLNFSDCRTMTLLARHLTLWDMCVAQYGQDKGNSYFNQLFGPKNKDIPSSNRLLLSQMAEFSGLIRPPGATKQSSLTTFPINPFSLFVGYDFKRSSKVSERQLIVGDVIMLANHPDYSKKHRAGPWAGFDMLYCGELGLIGFGMPKGKRFLTEPEMKALFLEAYLAPQTEYEKYYDKAYQFKPQKFIEEIKLEDIPGSRLATPRRYREFTLDALYSLDSDCLQQLIQNYTLKPNQQSVMAVYNAILADSVNQDEGVEEIVNGELSEQSRVMKITQELEGLTVEEKSSDQVTIANQSNNKKGMRSPFS